ncbi:MAG TPA: hypothetical protein VIC07_10480 [Acidimicrobiia bacterium]
MLSSDDLRRLAAARPGRMLIDGEGRLIEIDGFPGDAPVPGLLVGPVTEAVKRVDDGFVRHLSRDTLWVVEGFLLDDRLIEALPSGIESASGLIEAVRAAGHEWQVVHHPASGSADPLVTDPL